jgi:hypothetical protein
VNPQADEEKVLAAFGMTASQAEAAIHPEKVGPRLPPLGPETNPPSAEEFIKSKGQMLPVDQHPGIPDEVKKVMKDKIGPDVQVEATQAEVANKLPKHEPFADIDDPDVLFLINEWGVTEKERVIVRTKVESFTIRNIIKREGYEDQIEYEETFRPVNLPCDFIVDHVPQLIAETGSGIRVVSEVIRRASREMDLTIMAVIQDRRDDKQREIRARSTRIKEGGTPIGKPAKPEQEEL